MKKLLTLVVLLGVTTNVFAVSATLNSVNYAMPNVGANVTYNGTMTLKLVAMAHYFDGVNSWTGTHQLVASQDVTGTGTITLTGPVEAMPNCVGWDLEVYLIQNGTIVGWTNEVYVSRG
jgi:hypothetical protein